MSTFTLEMFFYWYGKGYKRPRLEILINNRYEIVRSVKRLSTIPENSFFHMNGKTFKVGNGFIRIIE
jgi:hypothetical protein